MCPAILGYGQIAPRLIFRPHMLHLGPLSDPSNIWDGLFRDVNWLETRLRKSSDSPAPPVSQLARNSSPDHSHEKLGLTLGPSQQSKHEALSAYYRPTAQVPASYDP